ncbi:hypothetical protein DCW30_27695 [Streptomyces alfalfae]|nr:hypothetical protein D3X13_08775 [Streptomyces fradiae]RXX38285.1 hypothetical protein DCW30_27695 [Streptomyces alfalfae]RZN00991.1 hypothetical protein D4104_08320 [Streptomyces alfalfae]
MYSCWLSRGDALFELCDPLLCTDGPVRTLVDLTLAPACLSTSSDESGAARREGRQLRRPSSLWSESTERAHRLTSYRMRSASMGKGDARGARENQGVLAGGGRNWVRGPGTSRLVAGRSALFSSVADL